MRVAVVLPGLHKVVRGAEVAFEAIAQELSQYADVKVTLFGSGEARPEAAYRFVHVDCIPRQKFETLWPVNIPLLRDVNSYEELTFALNLFRKFNPHEFDATITCSYPFLNWFLNLKRQNGNPAHIFVTQNSDYAVVTPNREFRFFKCDGLVCTNPQYFERNQDRPEWLTTLIPNGVNPAVFKPGPQCRERFDLPEAAPIALMVSALIAEKRVLEGIKAAAEVPDLHLVVCGDGPQRAAVKSLGQSLMGDRFHLKQLPFAQMPDMYRTADLFLHLNLNEPFGNVYLEAMATGLPIVAHDREVTRWIVGDHATLVDSTQPSELVQGLHEALKEAHQTETVSDKLDFVNRRFSWSSIAREYYQFIQQVLATRQAQVPSVS